MTISELKKIMADAGCVGAGGAGFPSAFKLAEGANALVINAAECEPLLYTDYQIMKQHMDDVTGGAEAVMEALGVKEGYLAVKHHTAVNLGLQHGQKLSKHVQVAVMPDVYPMGDEIIMIYQVLGRIVPPGALPIAVGVVVYNVETLYNVNRAVKNGTPVTEKWLTVGGKVDTPVVLTAPIGTPVSEVLKKTGVTVPDDCVIIDGGPMMGPIIDPTTALITKTTKGLLILPKDSPVIVSKLQKARAVSVHASANCCQCSMCTDMCPRALIGYPLRPHKIVKVPMQTVEKNPAYFTEASVCCGCGVCELTACCQAISPRGVYAQVKAILAKNKLRYQHKGGELKADPDRDFRLLPSSRLQQRIGTLPFDRVAEFKRVKLAPKEVTLALRQHIGAPASPAVKVGDAVQIGTLVGAAAEGISANIHSSVNGTVKAVTATEVVTTVQ